MQSTTAKFYNRSHDAMIRVYDDAGNVDRDARAQGRFQRVMKPSVQPPSSLVSHKRKKKVSTFLCAPNKIGVPLAKADS
jgi:hypothetical protein